MLISASVPPSLFGLNIIPVYGVLMAIGFAGSFLWAYIDWNRNNYRTWDFIYMSLFVSGFALFGAKIWYMIFDPTEAFKDIDDFLSLLTIVFIPTFGRSIIGSIISIPFGIIVYKKFWGPDINVLKTMDIMLPALFLGQAVGRWGNFANHDLYGGIVSAESLNWLPEFIKKNMYIDDAYRSPIFLYESIANIAGLMLILIVFKSNKYWKDGCAGMFYFLLYGVIRSSIEPFRDTEFIMYWWNIPTSYITALIMSMFGLFGLILLQWLRPAKNRKLKT